MQQTHPPIAPIATLLPGLIKPHDGVIIEHPFPKYLIICYQIIIIQPVIRPLHRPYKLIFFVLLNNISVRIQVTAAEQAATYVFVIAFTVRTFIANSLDPLNPNHPKIKNRHFTF